MRSIVARRISPSDLAEQNRHTPVIASAAGRNKPNVHGASARVRRSLLRLRTGQDSTLSGGVSERTEPSGGIDALRTTVLISCVRLARGSTRSTHPH